MRQNLFTVLARGARGNLENYCTGGLAWILSNDLAARSALLEAFVAGLSGTALEAVQSLAAEDALDIRPHEWIALTDDPRRRRWVCPDLRIADQESRACMLVQVKAGARLGMRPSLVKSEPDTRQTQAYRRWLDANHPHAGALCLMATEQQSDLPEECDAALTWTEVVVALRAQSGDSVTLQFCDFLEGKLMANKDLALSEEDVRSLANSAWEPVGLLLDEVNDRLSATFSSDKVTVKVREKFVQTLLVSGDQWIWTGSIVLSSGRSRLEVTPYLRINDGPVQFLVGLVCADLTLASAQKLLPDSQIEDDEREINVLIDHNPWALGQPSTRRQADEIARVAADEIRPLVLDVLSQGE